MGEWSEYFEDFPGGYFGEHPETLPKDPGVEAHGQFVRNLERARQQGAAEVRALVDRHTPPDPVDIARSLDSQRDRPKTVPAFRRWINAEFNKSLSEAAGRRLVRVLETGNVLQITADERVVYRRT